MNQEQEKTLEVAKAFVTAHFSNKVNSHFVFHNMDHVNEVVDAAKIIADYYHLDEGEKYILSLAAYFHDAGFSSGEVKEHEERGVEIAKKFLQEQNLSAEIIHGVTSCIYATKMPQEPQNAVEKILCDADLFHLGTEYADTRAALLKAETEFYCKTKISTKDWLRANIKFLKSHNYFTEYGRRLLDPVKLQRIKELETKLYHMNGS